MKDLGPSARKRSLDTTAVGTVTTGDPGTVPAAHTPGPWTIYDMNPTVVLAERYSTPYAVANCEPPPLSKKMSAATAQANARLIAAAPNMEGDGAFLIARLLDFEVALDGGDDAGLLMRDWYGHVSPALARFRNTIRTATAGLSDHQSAASGKEAISDSGLSTK